MEAKSVENIIKGIEGAEKHLGVWYDGGYAYCKSTEASVSDGLLVFKNDERGVHTFIACGAITCISVDIKPPKALAPKAPRADEKFLDEFESPKKTMPSPLPKPPGWVGLDVKLRGGTVGSIMKAVEIDVSKVSTNRRVQQIGRLARQQQDQQHSNDL